MDLVYLAIAKDHEPLLLPIGFGILRATDLAQRLRIALVWLVNCSGAKLPDQHQFYANRRGAGPPFSSMPNWPSSAFRFWQEYTAPTRPEEATKASAP